MNSEENTIRLIEKLDQAFDEIEKIDQRLKDYEDKINAVGDAVRLVGERDNVIQLKQNNQQALVELLDGMVSTLDFPSVYKDILLECNLSSPQRIQKCVQAADELMDVLEADIHPSLRQMKAYEEQRKLLEFLKIKFANSLYEHFRNAIAHATNKHLESYKIIDNSLNELPTHGQIHSDLLIYKDLFAWLQRSGSALREANRSVSYFDVMQTNYIDAVKQLYMRELIPFVSCARAKIIKNEQKLKNCK
jgi:hypothetical protein